MNRDSKSHDIFREIFEKSSAAMLLISADRDIVMLNDSFYQLTGYSKEELIGVKWDSKISVENVDRLREFNQRRLLKDPEVPKEYELCYKTKKGRFKYALLSASLIEQTSQTICTFLDITERKAVEEELRVSKEYYQSIVEYAGDIIFTINSDGYYNYISPVLQEKFGYRSEEIIGVHLSSYVHPDDLLYVMQCFDQVVAKGEKLTGVEFRVKHKNGKWLWASISASPIVNDNGEITTIIGVGNDITHRKNIENALQRSEKFLWTLLNNIPDIIWLKDAKGVYVACNEAYQKTIGKKTGEIVGNTDYDILSIETADFLSKMDKKVIAANKAYRNEEKIFFPGISREVFLDTIKNPVFSDGGELLGVLGIARDITERKQMEEKLSENLTFFKESQQAGFIGSYKYDFNSQKLEFSEVLEQLLGAGPDNEIKIATWYDFIHPEDQERIVSELKKKIQQKTDFCEDYRIVHKSDKKTRWVQGIGKLVSNKDGNIQFLTGTVQDITDRKMAENAAFESQTKLTIALKLAHLGPWEYNVDKDRFYFSDTFYALYKTSSQQMRGESMTREEYAKKFVHPDDIDVVSREMDKALYSQTPMYIKRLEHRMLYANGEEGYVAVQIALVKDKAGRVLRMFGINQDITAVKRGEEELRRSAKELQELNAMKDKFFSIIAHDLKGPFTTIEGFSELLLSQLEEYKPDKIKMFSQYILESSHRAMDLLTNLLEWSRSETGRMDFKPEEINLIEVINSSIELLLPTAQQKKISIKPLQNIKINVIADSVMISTVFRNLFSNAIKFTHENGEVKVLIQKKEAEWLIKVIDNGVGISEHRIKKMFRIYQNGSTLGTHEEKGTGLGLVLCKEFVEKHGGKIWVNSQINKGSEFCMTLPFQISKETKYLKS